MDCGQKKKCLFKHKNNASCRNLDASHVLLFLRTFKWMFTYGEQYPKTLQHINSSVLKCYWIFSKLYCAIDLIPPLLFEFSFFRYQEYFIYSYQESIQHTCFAFCVYQYLLAYNKNSILQNCVEMKKEFTACLNTVCDWKGIVITVDNMHFDMQN